MIIPSAFRRKFDVIAVWKLDRFGRSLRHLVNAIAEFEALGVAFISLRDNLDLGTPAGRLMFQIIGAMAEFERSLIQERLQEGARAAGRLPNRTRTITSLLHSRSSPPAWFGSHPQSSSQVYILDQSAFVFARTN